MAHIGEHCQVELGKSLGQAARPGEGEERVMLRPPEAGGKGDGRQGRRRALHHGDASGMGGAAIGETAIEISRAHEIPDEGGEHPVEGFLAIGPMPQDMADLGFAGGWAAAHKAGGDGALRICGIV